MASGNDFDQMSDSFVNNNLFVETYKQIVSFGINIDKIRNYHEYLL